MPTPLTPPTLERVLQGVHESEIRCGIQNEPPAGGITAWIDYGSRTEKATFYGTIVGDQQVWPAADRIAAWMMRPRCASSLIAPMPKRTAVDRRARVLRPKSTASGPEAAHPPKWIEPQLTRLIEEAPEGTDWLHEIKYDGYRMHARVDGDKIQLLTRTGLDWSPRYKRTIEALRSLKVKSVYLDGKLCALNADGVPVFSRLQAAMDEGRTDQLVFFAFDLLYLNGESTAQLPLIKRKERLKRLFKKEIQGLRYNEHVTGDGPRFREHACKLGLEGVISKRADRPYAPGDRGIWVKSKCLNREEFVVVGWTDPEGSRRHIGALLLGYYTEDGQLHYAGRAGTGMNDRELKRLAGVLAPLQVPNMPLAAPPPRDNRFGSPLKLSKVHWVRPEVVVEVTYLTWTEGGLLRAVSYQGQREDKPAGQVVRLIPHPPGRR